MAEKHKTVTVEALQVHTYNGKEYKVGDTYEIDEQFADSVATQGKAIRTDRVEVAKKAEKDAKATVDAREKAAAKPTLGKHKN